MANPRLIAEARAMLADLTPLTFDCGTLCDRKCCTDHAPDVGVYLLPGELALFDGCEDWIRWRHHRTTRYEFAPSWSRYSSIPFMQCTALCERERRPFECRTYPLVPFLLADGRLEMRYSPWAEGVCPLTERYRLQDLDQAFMAAAGRAWGHLLQDPEMLDHVHWVTDQLKVWSELPHTTHEQ